MAACLRIVLARVAVTLVLGFAAALGLGGEGRAAMLPAVAPVASCEALQNRIMNAESDPVRITSAKVAPDNPAAPFCQVKGYVAPQVQFELRLPLNNWHQRLLFLGCGGFCGGVGTRAWAMAGCEAYDRGEFAAVYSDLGHTAAHSDAVWATNNPQGLRDFGRRGVHVVTLAARQIIAAFYGKGPRYSYFSGCSDGGREALMAAQRYPADFDGIVAGAPAANLTMNNSVYHAWFVQHLLSRDRKVLLSDAQLAALHAEVIRQCDGLDRANDGVITDPAKCRPALDRLRCTDAAPLAGCLTASQIAAVLAIYDGPKGASGRALYHGVAPGSEMSWSRQIMGSADYAGTFTSFMTGAAVPTQTDVWALGYTPADLKRYDHHAAELNALDPDLTRFRQAGGKLLMWHGSADSSIPPGSSVDYVAAVRRKLGPANVATFLRFYLVPGMGHCTGGEGPARVDFLSPLMRWVEDGVAPGNVAAEGRPGAAAWALRPSGP